MLNLAPQPPSGLTRRESIRLYCNADTFGPLLWQLARSNKARHLNCGGTLIRSDKIYLSCCHLWLARMESCRVGKFISPSAKSNFSPLFVCLRTLHGFWGHATWKEAGGKLGTLLDIWCLQQLRQSLFFKWRKQMKNHVVWHKLPNFPFLVKVPRTINLVWSDSNSIM